MTDHPIKAPYAGKVIYPRGDCNPTPKPVPVRGVEYPSRVAAARALGVSRNAVYLAEKNGTLDALGLKKAARASTARAADA